MNDCEATCDRCDKKCPPGTMELCLERSGAKWLCKNCFRIVDAPIDDLADDFISMWEKIDDMKLCADQFEEPHRTTLIEAIGKLNDMVESVNKATDPRQNWITRN